MSWFNFRAFKSILSFYRTDQLHVEDGVCALAQSEDLKYWLIDEMNVEPCCLANYIAKKEKAMEEIPNKLEDAQGLSSSPTTRVQYQTKLWNLMDKPSTSFAAKVTKKYFFRTNSQQMFKGIWLFTSFKPRMLFF